MDISISTEGEVAAIQSRLMERGKYGVAIAVAREHGITTERMLSRDHRPPAASARFSFWFELHEEHRLSYPEIGRLVDRDHTTVRSGVLTHARRLIDGGSDGCRVGGASA